MNPAHSTATEVKASEMTATDARAAKVHSTAAEVAAATAKVPPASAEVAATSTTAMAATSSAVAATAAASSAVAATSSAVAATAAASSAVAATAATVSGIRRQRRREGQHRGQQDCANCNCVIFHGYLPGRHVNATPLGCAHKAAPLEHCGYWAGSLQAPLSAVATAVHTRTPDLFSGTGPLVALVTDVSTSWRTLRKQWQIATVSL